MEQICLECNKTCPEHLTKSKISANLINIDFIYIQVLEL